MHFIDNEKIDESSIKSEEQINGKKGGPTDVVVVVEARNIAIEIETMYGTGDPIGAKINHRTIRPYLEGKFSG